MTTISKEILYDHVYQRRFFINFAVGVQYGMLKIGTSEIVCEIRSVIDNNLFYFTTQYRMGKLKIFIIADLLG